MFINLEEALSASKSLVYGPFFSKGFSEYSRVYFVTSECIKDYLAMTNFAKDRALTVLSGGDQVFNLIASGMHSVDTFDINRLTYFVYHLRKAMIKTYDPSNFEKANQTFTSANYTTSERSIILDEVKPYLPEKVYEYYRHMLEFCSGNPLVNFESLYFYGGSEAFLRNNYLGKEQTYQKLQRKLDDVEVTFTFSDATTLPEKLLNTYDIILLSNIADYLSYNRYSGISEFHTFIGNYYDLLNPDGVLINYIYNRNRHPIKKLPFTLEELGIAEDTYSVSEPIFKKAGESFYLMRKPKTK